MTSSTAAFQEPSLYRAVVDSQSEIICRRRSDGRIVFVNQAYCDYFSKSAVDLVDSDWQPTAAADDSDALRLRLAALKPALPGFRLDRYLLSGHGEARWMHHIYMGIFDADGQLVEYQAVGYDVDERKQMETSLRQAQEMLKFSIAERTRAIRQMALQITELEDRERRAIARDLHDDLGQRLHVIKFKLDQLRGELSPPSTDAAAKLRVDHTIEELAQLVQSASAQVRTLTTQLGSKVLEDYGACHALQSLCNEIERTYGLRIDVRLDCLPQQIPAPIGSILYRGIRELLINVTKHAATDRASLTVLCNGHFIKVAVEDAGRGSSGWPARSCPNSFGLSSLEERIKYLGGVFKAGPLDAGRQLGFRVEFLMPLRDVAVAEQGAQP